MGIPDFGAVFDVLDPSCKGYLTASQVQEFYQTLYFKPILRMQVDAAVLHICGSGTQGKVHKENFVEVLKELDRRKTVEDKARWDFMSLDVQGSTRLSLKDALLLFQMTHGPEFSMHTWHQFLVSRELPEENVSFDEMRMWLCNKSIGGPSNLNEITSEEDRLKVKKNQEINQDFDNYMQFEEERVHRASKAKQREEYREKTQRLSRRKMHRWETEGVDALLADDGVDHGEVVPDKVRSRLNINDIFDLLDHKYEALRTKLLWHMIKNNMGSALFSSMGDHEQYEMYHQMQNQEAEMRGEGSLTSRAVELYGADVMHESALQGMMGKLREEFMKDKNNMLQRRKQYKAEGKSPEAIDKIFQDEYNVEAKARCNSGKLLADLFERYEEERAGIRNLLRDNRTRSLTIKMMAMYCELTRQNMLVSQEETFASAAIATGLAERPQQYRAERFDPDRPRQEKLATSRLSARKGRKLWLTGDDGEPPLEKRAFMMEMQLDVVQEMAKKHTFEREVLVHLLLGKDSSNAKAAARQLSADQKLSKLTSLCNQRNAWRDSPTDFRKSQQQQHMQILQEGAGLYYDTRRQELGRPGEDVINASILADLQQRQDEEFDSMLLTLQTKSDKEVRALAKLQRKMRVQEMVDNIAFVVLGAFQCSDEEKLYIDTLEEKYDVLRNVMYMHELQLEYGGAWDRLSNEERERLMNKKEAEEKSLRQDGRMEEMSKICSRLNQELGSLRAFLGEDRAEYSRRVAKQQEQREQAMLTGHNLASVPNDEATSPPTKSMNLLADLANRFVSERDAIMSFLRSQNALDKREQQLMLVLLQIESRLAEKEITFDAASYSVGLIERIQAAADIRHSADQRRQHSLANLRLKLWEKRQAQDLLFLKEPEEKTPPAKGDTVGWQEALLHEMKKVHREEWEIYLNVVMDKEMEDLREAADTMPEREKQTRLSELYAKYQRLELDDPGQRDENISIMEEAAAIRLTQKKRIMQSKEGHEVSWANTVVALLTEIQDQQDQQTAQCIQRLSKMSEEDVKLGREDHIMARRNEAAENVLIVLTRFEGAGEDQELLKALEDKYDVLRDKLLLEALMKQVGEAEWNKLSEEERQRRLVQMKLAERRLRREGKWDELSKLLGEGAEHDEALRKLMGDHRAEYDRKLRERLARRQKRIEEGLDPDDDEDSSIDEMDGDGEETKKNIFEALHGRYEDEKDALMARLRGQNDEYVSERERQAELVRLRHERRRAQMEDNFDSAAMMIGLAERQQAEAEERLKKDRERQEQLAKARLAALRSRKSDKKRKQDDEVIREGGKHVLQDVIMKRLDENHEQERELLAQLLLKAKSAEQKRLVAKGMSQLERADKLEQLKEKRSTIYPEKVSEHQGVLEEGCVVRLEDKLERLTEERPEASITAEDAEVSLMADLQEQQDREAAAYINSLADKDEAELIELQLKILYSKKHQWAENVGTIVFGQQSNRAGEKEILDALDAKYDALRDKLLAEALIQQVGEREWAKLSEQERQRRLAELKLKERQLRREGKMDEAAELLGTAFQEHEALQNMMGLSKEEQQRKLQERLNKRKERRAAGMTEEECDQLEEQDIEQEEEELRKQRRNILLDLVHQHDKEKEELMKGLRDSDNHLISERQRQLELSRLRREQRRAKQEEKFDAAAIALGLAKEGEKAKEEERKRQEALARQRLEARRNRKSAPSSVKEGEIAVPYDTNDLVALQDVVLQELERKQQHEREVFLQVLQEGSQGTYRAAAQKLDAEARKDRLMELTELRRKMLDQGQISEKEHTDILKEAAAIHLEILKFEKEEAGLASSDDDLQVSLLADFQEKQDQEMQKLVTAVSEEKPEVLSQLKQAYALGFKEKWLTNVASVLLGEEKDTQADPSLKDGEKELVKLLEQKYDALRDKLLAEALMKQVGEREWARMSERDRQAQIVKLRLQERKLREEGRYDEAAALLGQLAETQDELQKSLGETKAEQKRRLEARLQRRKELLAEREAKGLSTTDAVLDAILEEEEAEQEAAEGHKRKNILESLQNHFEDEKDRLLAQLRNQEDQAAMERQRQLERARLRREQRQLEKEDKFDAAAILITMAKEEDELREANLGKERERQRQLAKERLEAKKRKRLKGKAPLPSIEEDEQQMINQLRQEEEENRLQEVMRVASEEKDGSQLHETILSEMERKQNRERDLLLELIQAAEKDKETGKEAQTMNTEELKMHLEMLRQERTKWRNKSLQAAFVMSDNSADMTQAEKDQYLAKVAQSRSEQFKLLTKAMVYRLQVEKIAVKQEQPDLSAEQQHDEICVALLADLQLKQEAENNMMNDFMAKQDAQALLRLHETEEMARREGWVDNLANTIFTMLGDPGKSADRECEEAMMKENEQLEKELEQELEQEREECINNVKKRRAAGETVDMEAALAELAAQQEAKRKAHTKNMERQKRLLHQRLQARRQAQDTKEYEADTAHELVRLMERTQTFLQDKTEKERGKQGNLLQKRLAARREARRAAAEESVAIHSEPTSRLHSPMSRPGSMDSTVPLGMRREKSVLDIDVSEDAKKEMYTKLLHQQKALHKKLTAEQSRQEEILQRRLEARKGKRDAEAEALFTLGQRQRTILEKSQKEQRDRQLTMMKERVARVRYERTQTMKDGGQKGKRFDDLVAENEAEGMSENEKMQLAAKRMQEKFKQEEEDVKTGKKKTNITEETAGDGEDPRPAKLMDENARIAKIRARREERRRRREEMAKQAEANQTQQEQENED